MTAAQPRPRPALEVVTDLPTPSGDTARAAAVIDQYAAEHQFVGSLMWLAPGAARTLLETTDRTIADIACETGFYDHSHFTRTFKIHTGQTPSKYK